MRPVIVLKIGIFVSVSAVSDNLSLRSGTVSALKHELRHAFNLWSLRRAEVLDALVLLYEI